MEYPTLIIHGFLAHKITNLPLHLGLRRHGIRTFNVPIPGLNTQDVDKSSLILSDKVKEVLEKTGANKVNIIGVSLGGVIALHYIRCGGGRAHVDKTITLGSPLKGAPVAHSITSLPLVGGIASQLLHNSQLMQDLHAPQRSTADVISIYADGDILVPKERSDIEGATLIKAPVGNWPIGHYQMPIDPRNIQFIVAQLRHTPSSTQVAC